MRKILSAISALIFSSKLLALTFPLEPGADVIGELQTAVVKKGESLGMIGRKYNVGVFEMIEANPGLDPWVPTVGATVVIPTQFILPPGNREGIVLNLAEMRLYFYHPDKKKVTTFPVGIGKKGWSTPLGETTILSKTKDPIWTPPPSIRREHEAKGDILPAFIPAGPENPLGRYAFRLGFSGFLLHGSNRPGGIGVRSSHGCVRMFPEDIEAMYYSVPVGTKVRIIHEPYKVGWHGSSLYVEAHQPLSEPKYKHSTALGNLERIIQSVIQNSHMVNWNSAKQAAKSTRGYPVRID